jgi:hypothetical protein
MLYYRLLLRFVLLCFPAATAAAQNAVIFNFGIRLTQCFDERNWQLGIEGSLVKWSKGFPEIQGIVWAVDWHEKRKRAFLGYEMTGPYTLGIAIGPSLVTDGGTRYAGFTVSGYVGAGIYLQPAWTYYGKDSYGEVAFVGKIPIRLGGSLELP